MGLFHVVQADSVAYTNRNIIASSYSGSFGECQYARQIKKLRSHLSILRIHSVYNFAYMTPSFLYGEYILSHLHTYVMFKSIFSAKKINRDLIQAHPGRENSRYNNKRALVHNKSLAIKHDKLYDDGHQAICSLTVPLNQRREHQTWSQTKK